MQHEQAVVGAMMVDPKDEYTPFCLSYLSAEDFADANCRDIFSAILKLFQAKSPHDMICVADSGIGFDVLAPLVDSAFLYNTKHHATVVKTNSMKRKAIMLAHSITEDLGRQYFTNPDEVSEFVTTRLSLEIPRIDRKPENMMAICEEVLNELEREQNGERRPLRYGIAKLDQLTGGLWPAELTIVAAGPGMGKTAFALSTAVNVAKSNKAVHICSLEMNRVQVAKRLMSRVAHIPSDTFKGKMSDEAWRDTGMATNELAKLRITVDESTKTIQELVNKATRMHEAGNLDMLVLDYLQLTTSSRRHESRRQEVEYVSRELKLLSRSLGIPVVALSQLTREGQKNTKPRLYDLRESGAIEQDADNVIFLWDDEAEKHIAQEIVNMNMIVAKQRSGRTAEIPVKFVKPYMMFAGVE